MTSDLSDFQTVLIMKAAEGDNDAFKILYDQLSGKMYSLCLRYASSQNLADDLFQEGFIKVFNKLKTFRNEGSFEGWARQIFVNTCLDSFKKKQFYLPDVENYFESEGDGNDALQKLSIEQMMNLIRQMPPGYRTMINLSCIEEFSHKEISEMLGITETASKSKLHKARKYLQTMQKTANFE